MVLMLARLLLADDVSKILGVPTLRVYELARSGMIPCVRIGRQVRFAPEALQEFVVNGGRGLGRQTRQHPTTCSTPGPLDP